MKIFSGSRRINVIEIFLSFLMSSMNRLVQLTVLREKKKYPKVNPLALLTNDERLGPKVTKNKESSKNQESQELFTFPNVFTTTERPESGNCVRTIESMLVQPGKADHEDPMLRSRILDPQFTVLLSGYSLTQATRECRRLNKLQSL